MIILNNNESRTPKVFISYSWEDDEHKSWVRSFADHLLYDGVDVSLDQYDLSLGDRLPQFMEQEISNADYVLIICTPTYREKSDARMGGVGYEGHIISGELFSVHNERKFIPVIRRGSQMTSIPKCLEGKVWVDLTEHGNYNANYKDLVETIFGGKQKPTIGKKPSYIKKQDFPNHASNNSMQDEPIRIIGIITSEVTMPRLDGTRGSALYKIPFRLSKIPSRLWVELFVQEWNNPPQFTSMHRPGIASVRGDKIVLDGTTIEEVRDYHKNTLLLCVEEANKKEAYVLNKRKQQEKQERERIEEHNRSVLSVAENLKF